MTMMKYISILKDFSAQSGKVKRGRKTARGAEKGRYIEIRLKRENESERERG